MVELLEETGAPYETLITDCNRDGIDGKHVLQVITGRRDAWDAVADLAALHSFDAMRQVV